MERLLLLILVCFLVGAANAEDMNSVRKEAESGNPEAQCKIAREFVNIRYNYDFDKIPEWLKIDEKIIVGWLKKLAETGNPEAQYLLARAYVEELTEDSDDDDKKKMSLLQKAAEQNHNEAQFELGTYYKDGYGTEGKKNPELALKWLTKAAENGNKEAPYFIGLMYYEGDGVKKDHSKAAEWFKKSSDDRAKEFLDKINHSHSKKK